MSKELQLFYSITNVNLSDRYSVRLSQNALREKYRKL